MKSPFINGIGKIQKTRRDTVGKRDAAAGSPCQTTCCERSAGELGFLSRFAFFSRLFFTAQFRRRSVKDHREEEHRGKRRKDEHTEDERPARLRDICAALNRFFRRGFDDFRSLRVVEFGSLENIVDRRGQFALALFQFFRDFLARVRFARAAEIIVRTLRVVRAFERFNEPGNADFLNLFGLKTGNFSRAGDRRRYHIVARRFIRRGRGVDDEPDAETGYDRRKISEQAGQAARRRARLLRRDRRRTPGF